jgi:hypothetical protein
LTAAPPSWCAAIELEGALAFVLKKGGTFVWPVKIEIPVSGGKFEKSTFDAEFKRLENSRVREMLEDKNMTDSGFANDVLVGWTGIKDEAGDDVAYSEQAKRDVLEVPGLAKVVVLAFLDAIAGAKAKN